MRLTLEKHTEIKHIPLKYSVKRGLVKSLLRKKSYTISV